ncbi:MAG TPA: PrsW family glutamic-type intramembrane protease [Anaeromyxobacter sp.]|nr:PrsW family glutamic-type intramembrane protease [Anaeromyxobacter sp.]
MVLSQLTELALSQVRGAGYGVLACVACGTAWTVALAWHAPEGAIRAAIRGILGGLAAFGAAWCGYAILERQGMAISWEGVLAGGPEGLSIAAAIGFVEEAAKLFGLALASAGTRGGPGVVARRVVAVSAAFATVECAVTVARSGPALLLLRSLLAPVAHAALAAPLGLVLVGGRRGIAWTIPALLMAALLHGAADLSLALPNLGRLGYAAVLIAPVLVLHILAQRGAGRLRRTLPVARPA